MMIFGPRGEWVTSGWNCNPHILEERFSIATNSALAVLPVLCRKDEVMIVFFLTWTKTKSKSQDKERKIKIYAARVICQYVPIGLNPSGILFNLSP
mmetsp:Transcript_21145/g.30205  ORF Transcript_21145/g.30205 Transcript_21145/m.30205 type:complete len:96 (-) Transcript_21145:596-883(-)